MVLAVMVHTFPAAAEHPWAGPYLEVGIGLSDNDAALGQNDGRIDGVAQGQGRWRSDAGFVALGIGQGRGAIIWAAEVETEIGSHDMSPAALCRLGQVCARTNLIGRLGPVHRLRARVARVIAPGVAVSLGAGLSAAEVRVNRVFVQAASAAPMAAAVVRASSPFVADDLARGHHVVLGVNQRLTQRVSWGLSLLHERLEVTAQSAVAITAVTQSGPSSAVVRLNHQGDVTVARSGLRLSLTWHF